MGGSRADTAQEISAVFNFYWALGKHFSTLAPVHDRLLGLQMSKTDQAWKKRQGDNIVNAVIAVGPTERQAAHIKGPL